MQMVILAFSQPKKLKKPQIDLQLKQLRYILWEDSKVAI